MSLVVDGYIHSPLSSIDSWNFGGPWKFQLIREGAAGDEDNWEQVDDTWAIVKFIWIRQDNQEEVQVGVRVGVMDSVGTKHTNIDSTGTIEGASYDSGSNTWTIEWTPEDPVDPEDETQTTWRVKVVAVKTDTGIYTPDPPTVNGGITDYRYSGSYNGTMFASPVTPADPTTRQYKITDTPVYHVKGLFKVNLPYYEETYDFHNGLSKNSNLQQIMVKSNVEYDLDYRFVLTIGTIETDGGFGPQSAPLQTITETKNNPPTFTEKDHWIDMNFSAALPQDMTFSHPLAGRSIAFAQIQEDNNQAGSPEHMFPGNFEILEDNPNIA